MAEFALINPDEGMETMEVEGEVTVLLWPTRAEAYRAILESGLEGKWKILKVVGTKELYKPDHPLKLR